MINKEFVFDIDGTLYPIDGVPGKKFSESRLYAHIKENILSVLADLYKISKEDSENVYQDLKKRYNGSVSQAVEWEKGIKKSDYFRVTWDTKACDYLSNDDKLRGTLLELGDKFTALTTAPSVWALQVLDFLNVSDLFPVVITAESQLTKPDPMVFLSITQRSASEVNNWVSVGDQLHSDIIPAKRIGMTTVLVGNNSPEADFSIKTIHELPTLMNTNRWNL